jgi:hypothetical protein
VRIGNDTIEADTPNLAGAIAAAVKDHGYPASADADDINYPMTVLLLVILVVYVTMVYGPIAAWLSLPYHIGNGWFGFSAGNGLRYRGGDRQHLSGLWYPVAIAAMSFFVALIFLPETKDRDITG